MDIYREDHSVVTRYADRLVGVEQDAVRRTSLREGARIIALPPYRGVDIDLLDLSSLSTTGTFKDWLVVVAVAASLARGDQTVIAQSSGNTGNALARYAAHVGIRCLILLPATSRRRVIPGLAASPLVDFIEVDAAEDEIKRALALISEDLRIPTIPALRWQHEGNKLRAHFLHDAARATGRRWDWHVQALSSAYGPIGFYRGLEEVRRDDPGVRIPHFLGIQQEAATPYADVFGGNEVPGTGEMIEPTLFRRALTPALVEEMERILTTSDGAIRVVTDHRFRELEATEIELLGAHGVAVTMDDEQPRERAGLYSLTGTHEAIDAGTIPRGDRALVVYTGGSGPAAHLHEPEHVCDPTTALAVVTNLLSCSATS